MRMQHLLASTILGAAVAAVPVFAEVNQEAVRDAGQEIQTDAQRTGEEIRGEARQAGDRIGDQVDNQADQLRQGRDLASDAGKDLKLPAGFKVVTDADHSRDIRGTLASAISAALTEDGFDDMVERFVDQDRNRIGEADLNYDRFNAAVRAFRENWRNKYGGDFKFERDQAFSDIKVVSGEVTDSNLAMLNWPVKPDGAMVGDMGMARPAAAGDGMDKAADMEDRQEDANLEEGRDVALARISGEKDKHLTLSLINEAGGWKLDLPNNIGGQQLLDSVTKCIDMANQNQAQWPDDAAKAKQALSHKLLMAIYGIDDKGDKADANAQKANVLIQGDEQDNNQR